MANITKFLKPKTRQITMDLSFSKVWVSYMNSSDPVNPKEFILDDEIETGIREGYLDNSEKLRDVISYVGDFTSIYDKSILNPLTKLKITIVLRHKCPPWQKKLVQNITHQLLYDSISLTSYEEQYQDMFVVTYLENQAVFHRKKEDQIKLNTYPSVANRAVQQFIEAKYNVCVSTTDISDLLTEYFNSRPTKIGKKIITYEISCTRKDGKPYIINPSFHEISDSLGPTLKALAYDLDFISQQANASEVTFVTENIWLQNALKDAGKYSRSQLPNFKYLSVQEFRKMNTFQ